MSEETSQSNKRVDPVIVVAALIAAVAVAVMWFEPFNGFDQPEIVVFDTQSVAEEMTRDGAMAPKEIKEAIEERAEAMADDGHIVLRRSSVWSAPEDDVIEITE